MKKMVLGKFSPEKFPAKIATHQTPPLENFSWKIATQKILSWNIRPISLISFLHLKHFVLTNFHKRIDFSTFKT